MQNSILLSDAQVRPAGISVEEGMKALKCEIKKLAKTKSETFSFLCDETVTYGDGQGHVGHGGSDGHRGSQRFLFWRGGDVMKRKGKKQFLTRKQIDTFRFLAMKCKQTNAAEMEIRFYGDSDRILSSASVWKSVDKHGNIIRWHNNRFFYLPYKSFKAMPYKMTLAMYKSHKQTIK